MALFDRVHDMSRLITFMDYRITSLQQEMDALKSEGGPEAVAAAEERASELEKKLEKTKPRGDLSEAQRQQKEARVRARKMDDELLQSMKDLESTRVELPRWMDDDYKESAGFKESLKRMG
ncbi:hypothetical protein BHM03_00006999 [Ensete ventricosum]|nr:hypothetical protein BHM03_00006999 [Ensete ventricosum]